MKPIPRAVLIGCAAAVGLFTFYAVTLGLVSGRAFLRDQVARDWPFLAYLVPAFGLTVALYMHLRSVTATRHGKAVAASGGMSGAAMVACCAHYLPTVLPFLGITAFATVVTAWRTPLLIVAVASNLAGLAVIARALRHARTMANLAPPATGSSSPASSSSSSSAYTCPMHPDVHRPAPGACPECGMALQPSGPSGAGREAASPYARHLERTVHLDAPPSDVFAFLDDHAQLAGHMTRPSWRTAGSRFTTEIDEGGGRAVGSHVRMSGHVLGVPLALDEVVTEREAPRHKSWETLGVPRLLVVGAYRMTVDVEPEPDGSRVRIGIDYDLPERHPRLGRWFGDTYARWCVQQMTDDTVHHFVRDAA